jgi:uncharacterized membrane protein YphA (DoxX/SURF4 family)
MTTHVERQPHTSTLEGLGPKAEAVLTTKVARALFALPFVVFGFFHFVGADAMAAAVPVPGGVFWVYLTGAALIAGGIGVLTGILGRWAAYGLALLVGTFALTVHLPMLGDPAMQQMATAGFLKDTALAGAALAFAGTFAKRR